MQTKNGPNKCNLARVFMNIFFQRLLARTLNNPPVILQQVALHVLSLYCNLVTGTIVGTAPLLSIALHVFSL